MLQKRLFSSVFFSPCIIKNFFKSANLLLINADIESTEVHLGANNSMHINSATKIVARLAL